MFHNRNSFINRLMALSYVVLKEVKSLSANNELTIDVFFAEYHAALNYINKKDR